MMVVGIIVVVVVMTMPLVVMLVVTMMLVLLVVVVIMLALLVFCCWVHSEAEMMNFQCECLPWHLDVNLQLPLMITIKLKKIKTLPSFGTVILPSFQCSGCLAKKGLKKRTHPPIALCLGLIQHWAERVSENSSVRSALKSPSWQSYQFWISRCVAAQTKIMELRCMRCGSVHSTEWQFSLDI